MCLKNSYMTHSFCFTIFSKPITFVIIHVGSSIRQQVLGELKKKFKCISGAEDALGITIESYLEKSPGLASLPGEFQSLRLSPSLSGHMRSLTTSQVSDLIVEGLMYLVKETSGNAPAATVNNVLLAFLKNVDDMDIVMSIMDDLSLWFAGIKGIVSYPKNFVQTSLAAMKRLEANGKSNLVYKFCQGLAFDRPERSGPLIPINRMPFGLIEYCIEFFTCTNVMQV